MLGNILHDLEFDDDFGFFFKNCFCWACFVLFEMRSRYIVQIGLELLMVLAQLLSTRFTGVSYQAWPSDFVDVAQNA